MNSLIVFFLFYDIQRYIRCGAKFLWDMIFGAFSGFSEDPSMKAKKIKVK